MTRDLGEPVTEAPGYGVKQKGAQIYDKGGVVIRGYLVLLFMTKKGNWEKAHITLILFFFVTSLERVKIRISPPDIFVTLTPRHSTHWWRMRRSRR